MNNHSSRSESLSLLKVQLLPYVRLPVEYVQYLKSGHDFYSRLPGILDSYIATPQSKESRIRHIEHPERSRILLFQTYVHNSSRPTRPSALEKPFPDLCFVLPAWRVGSLPRILSRDLHRQLEEEIAEAMHYFDFLEVVPPGGLWDLTLPSPRSTAFLKSYAYLLGCGKYSHGAARSRRSLCLAALVKPVSLKHSAACEEYRTYLSVEIDHARCLSAGIPSPCRPELVSLDQPSR